MTLFRNYMASMGSKHGQSSIESPSINCVANDSEQAGKQTISDDKFTHYVDAGGSRDLEDDTKRSAKTKYDKFDDKLAEYDLTHEA